jgi:hypothetical protein
MDRARRHLCRFGVPARHVEEIALAVSIGVVVVRLPIMDRS